MNRHRPSFLEMVRAHPLWLVGGWLLGAAITIALLTLFGDHAHAQTRRPHKDSDKAAVAVFDRYLRAVGTRIPGPQHFITETRVDSAPPMRMETYLAPPDRLYLRATAGDRVLQEFGFDGTTGWASSPVTGLMRLEGPQLDMVRASVASFSAPTVDSTMKLLSLGRDTFDGHAADVIGIVMAEGDTSRVYYAVETGLALGVRARSIIGARRDTMSIHFLDYQRVLGQLQPMTMVYRAGGMVTTSRTILMETTAIDPGRFKVPAGVP